MAPEETLFSSSVCLRNFGFERLELGDSESAFDGIVDLALENSAATRSAFLMALVFDEPWVMMHTPFRPNSGAPRIRVVDALFEIAEGAA